MCSVAPPVVRPGHGERQRHRGQRGDLPVERAGQEELVEDHHGDGLAEDHTDGHHLQRRDKVEHQSCHCVCFVNDTVKMFAFKPSPSDAR